MTAIPESCGNCRYCYRICDRQECRRRPPSIGQDGTGQWPIIDLNCWCGEWDPLRHAAPRGGAGLNAAYAGVSG